MRGAEEPAWHCNSYTQENVFKHVGMCMYIDNPEEQFEPSNVKNHQFCTDPPTGSLLS